MSIVFISWGSSLLQIYDCLNDERLDIIQKSELPG